MDTVMQSNLSGPLRIVWVRW